MELAPSHIPTAKASGASAVTVQSLENDGAVSHPLHRHLENAGGAGVSHSRARGPRRGMGFRSKNKSKCKAKATAPNEAQSGPREFLTFT